jgi:DNA-binding transcriptional LysR family regulator
LRLLARTGEPAPWIPRVARARGSVRRAARANSPDLLIRLARAGSGIALVKHHFADPYGARRAELPVLPDWQLPRSTVGGVPGPPARRRARACSRCDRGEILGARIAQWRQDARNDGEGACTGEPAMTGSTLRHS